MKKILFLAFAAMMAVGASAQELANFSRNAQQIVSPEIKGDSVTFRLSANYATVVNLYGNWMANYTDVVPLTKGNDGVWEVTIAAPEPEIYTYNFIVHAYTVNDEVVGINLWFGSSDGDFPNAVVAFLQRHYISVISHPVAIKIQYSSIVGTQTEGY